MLTISLGAAQSATFFTFQPWTYNAAATERGVIKLRRIVERADRDDVGIDDQPPRAVFVEREGGHPRKPRRA